MKKILFNFSFLYIFKIFLITLSFNLKQIKADDDEVSFNITTLQCINSSSSENKDKYRPHFNVLTKCYDCGNILNITNKKYLIDEEGICKEPGDSDKKIVIETNEYLPLKQKENCSYFYDEFCYISIYEEKNDLSIELNDFDNEKGYQFSCLDKEKKVNAIKVQEKDYFKCVEECPYRLYNLDDNKCIEKCEGENKKIILLNATNRACTNSCKNSNKKLFNQKQGDKTIMYCVDNCPYSAPYYKDSLNPEQETECLPNCGEKNFYFSDTKKCSDTCDGDNFKSYIDFDAKIFICHNDQSNGCTEKFPYSYKNSCLKKCSDTKNFFDIDTFILINENNNKECTEKCQDNEVKKFFDKSTLTCYENCKILNKLNFNQECISACPPNAPYHISETGECVNKCSLKNDQDHEYYLSTEDNKTCYNYCFQETESQYKYIDIDNNLCLSKCEKPLNPLNLKIGEGYIFKNETNISGNIITLYYCLKSFENIDSQIKYYHKNNDNELLNISSCKEIESHKYNKYFDDTDTNNDNDYTCYKSCSDINENYKYEHNFICYDSDHKDKIRVDIYYIQSGIYKYALSNDTADSFCFSAGYKFIRNNECVSKCDSSEYKTLYEIDGNDVKLGQCLTECNNDYPYYSEEDKICYKICPYKQIFGSTQKSQKGNCLKECPEDFPNESINGSLCYDTCPGKFFRTINGKKKCVNDCKSISKYYFDSEFECIDECKKKDNNGSYIYYNESNNECLETCNSPNNLNKFALEAKNNHEPCRLQCPDNYKYYYDNAKICLNECKEGYRFNETSDVCVSSCNAGSFIIKGNICSDRCTKDEPFYKPKTIGGVTINKCVSYCNQEEEEDIYNFYYEHLVNLTVIEDDLISEYTFYECVPKCPNNYFIYGKQCVSECPKGLFRDNQKCVTKCSKYFVKNDDSDDYTCKENCGNKYITSSNECVDKCPFGENYIGNGNKCKSFCELLIDGEYYKYKDKASFNNITYNIYECLKECEVEVGGRSNYSYIIEDSKECIQKLQDDTYPYYLSESEKKYYSLCLSNEHKPFSTIKKKCDIKCTGDAPYYGEDKICVHNCSNLEFNKIRNEYDKSCVNKCDINSDYKYSKILELDGELVINSCEKKCDNYYSFEDYMCYNQCIEPNYFLISKSEKICNYKCLDGQFASPLSDEEASSSNAKYECLSGCKKDYYYYENDNICLPNCNQSHYIIQGTQKCIEFCEEITPETSSELKKKYYYYEKWENSLTFTKDTCVIECPNDKPYIDFNDHCTEECKSEGYKYYNITEKKCLNKCPLGSKINGYQCLSKCPGDKFENEKGECIDSCYNSQAGFLFYYESDKICKSECSNDDYKYKNEDNSYKCVTNCPKKDGKEMFIYDKECVDSCHDNKKYFIDIEGINKICMTDCPITHPFLIINNNEYKCYDSCNGSYITDKDPKKVAKLCLPNCNEKYPFSFKYNNTHKECFESCPNDYYYDNNSICYQNCTSESPYYEKDSKLCLKSCPYNTANFTTKECMTNCDITHFWITQNSGNIETKLCLNNCSQIDYTKFITPDKECVISCNISKNMEGDPKTGNCRCVGLFYYNSNGEKICLPRDTKSCEETDDYKIQFNGTNECLKTCLGVLSPDEKACYLGQNIICPNNTKIGLFDGKMKCDCQYNFYIDSKNKKICLEENENCPEERFLVPETNECIKECNTNYPYLFDKKCFNNCPYGTLPNETAKTCYCEYKWYKKSNTKFVCLNENEDCNSEYPYLIVDSNECVKNCADNGYSIINDNKCYTNCDDNSFGKIIDGKEVCFCKFNWYYDTKDKTNVCNPENKNKTCEEINPELKYLVKDTKECVSYCPENNKYYFNNECISSCDKEEDLKRDENNSTYECKCKEKWRVSDNNKIECISECSEDEYLIKNTGQCINTTKCPYDSPYLFNKECLQNCESEKLEIDRIKGDECKCKNLWYENNYGFKICMNENENCPFSSHPYLIYHTSECVKNKTKCSDLKIVNNTCYQECPLNTKNNSNECECDSEKGYWYKKFDEFGNKIVYCGLPNCTIGKEKYVNETKECVSICGEIEDYKYEYLNVCYSSCPPLTNVSDDGFSCRISLGFENEKNITNIIQNVRTEIVNIYKDIPEGGIVLSNNENDATMQIYGLNRNNKNKESIIRSNLAYIDLSGCIEKIYESYKKDDNYNNNLGDIVIVKLDLKSKNKKLVVNPIEYEFINSKTGEVLDASVCSKNEVVVSYPITYMLRNKKKLRNLQLEEDELQEILDKFERGKELYEKDNLIDSFNYNSTIYSDICYPIEVNGKDLTLENRISYFYPNYSFCESFCTYDYTDFTGERIYCNCSLKSGIEVDRVQNVKLVEYNKNETDNNQIGPTNIPVLKCIANAKISGNGAFYFCIIFIAVEIGLLFIIIFQGINALIDRIRSKIFGEEENNGYNEEDEKINNINVNKGNKVNNYINTNTNSNLKNLKTSERELEIPPKRKINDNSEKSDSENKDKEVINIKKLKHKSKEKEINRIIDEKNNYDIFSDPNSNNYDNNEFNKYLQKHGIETQMGFFHSMKKEEKLLRKKYSKSILEDKFDSIIVVLTSIFDKIYLIKILLLSGKYEIVSVMFSLYLLCHMLLLTFSGFFFDIKTIKRVWEEENYPDINYYLLYGFIGNLIVWIIFKLFYCLLENDNKITKIIFAKKIKNKNKKEEKLKKLIYMIKRNIIIYLSFQFILIMFCSFYLITFCGIYLGIRTKIFQAYGIAFIEIIIIKIIYGAILGILRKISLYIQNKILYNIILILNKYVS